MKHFYDVAGILGGTFWIILAFFPPLGAQETREYEVVWNRLWTPALMGMLLGFMGLFRRIRPALTRTVKGGFIALFVGFTLMILGNFAEYWLFSALPHQGPNGFMRGLAWMTVLLGLLVMQVASIVIGFFGFTSGCIPRWLSALFLLLFPATIAIGMASLNWAGIPTGITCIVIGVAGLLPGRSRSSLGHSA